jgi:long-chain acyl-CoA synthetase
MQITQTLRRAVQVNRHGTAVLCGQNKITYEVMEQRVAKLAGALRQLGVQSDTRVAMLSLNSHRYIEYYYAVPWAGGINVPLNIRLAPPELIYILNDSGSEILIVDDVFQAMLPAFAGKLNSVKQIVFAGDGATPAGAVNYEEILDAAKPLPDTLRGGEDIADILYTGGTTGLPKGVMSSHDNVMGLVMNTMVVLGGKPMVQLTTTPLFHISGAAFAYILSALGAPHVLLPKFDVEETLKAIQAHRATSTIWIPTMVNMIINHPAVEDYDLSSLQKIFYAASPMPYPVLTKAMQVFPNCQFYHVYGMTETTGGVTILEPEYHTTEGPLAGKIKSVGRAAFNTEVKIFDESDHELPRGQIGEIVMRGALVMQGYWNKPKETDAALRGGWMHSGDAGYMDEDGFVYIVDRLKDMIITGGENVYSAEVENAIYQHPAVAMCAVIGIPNSEWGESVHAIVVPKPGMQVSEEDILQHCRALIAGYKCPRSVTISAQPLPLSGAGKILKHVLRAPYWEGYEKQVN